MLGLALTALVHLLVLWMLSRPSGPEVARMERLLAVRLIAPDPQQDRQPELRPPRQAHPAPKQLSSRLEAERPLPSPQLASESLALSAPASTSVSDEAPASVAEPLPLEPALMAAELALVCAQRVAPEYPRASREDREAGLVVLRVEISESGAVAAVQVERSSGHPRLDEAAMRAVRLWHCTPPLREGRPVRGLALQPFSFVLGR